MNNEKERKMAIIKGIRFGFDRDVGRVTLRFSTYIDEGIAALQVLSAQEAIDLIRQYELENISDLNGKPCWVVVAGLSTMSFVGACVI